MPGWVSFSYRLQWGCWFLKTKEAVVTRSNLSTVGASFLVLAIFTVPLGLTVSDYLSGSSIMTWFIPLAPLGALLASAVGQLIYLERNLRNHGGLCSIGTVWPPFCTANLSSTQYLSQFSVTRFGSLSRSSSPSSCIVEGSVVNCIGF